MKDFFMNPWVITIGSGLIVAILISLFKYKHKISSKHSVKVKKGGSLRANSMILGHKNPKEPSPETKSHELEIDEGGEINVTGDLTIGNENECI